MSKGYNLFCFSFDSIKLIFNCVYFTSLLWTRSDGKKVTEIFYDSVTFNCEFKSNGRMRHLSDIEIIDSINRGNVSDFSLIVERYKDKAFSLLKRLLKNELDAEEALQDSFLKVYNSLKNFRKDSQFSTWIYKIVFNTGLTVLSSKKRKIEQQMSSIDEEFELSGYNNEVYAASENVREYILKMVDQLPIRNALVVILFYMDGMSLNEISQVLGISLVNTKVLLHRSRNALKDLLLKHNYQEEML